MISKRFQIHPKMIPACYKDCPTSYKNEHPITRSHWLKASSRSLQSNFKIFEIKLQRMASLGPSMVVIRDGISPNVCCPYDSWPHSLGTYFETTWTLDWVWREGVMLEPLKNHSTSCARHRAWTARAEDHTRKRWRIKRGRKNQGREGWPRLKKGKEK